MSTNLKVNGKPVTCQSEPDTPLLWVIRDELGLTGTKFGCGAALCGAHALCMLMAAQFVLVRRCFLALRIKTWRRSSHFLRMPVTHCNVPGLRTMFLNVVIVSQGS